MKNNNNFDEDEINANQALGEVLRQAQNTSLKRIGSPFNMSSFSRVEYRQDAMQGKFRDIYLTDEALLTLIQYMGMKYIVKL